jgi:16S rRNA (guanine527-N7)-methyltransferase
LTPAGDWGELSVAAAGQLRELVEMLASEPDAPSSVRDPEDAWRVHVADSLSGLEIEGLRQATRIADVGAGAGFPGIVLAAALPEAQVDLIESSTRKCRFMRRALDRSRIARARVVCERAETWAAARPPEGGRESYEVVVSRAVGRLATLAELASPLLASGGLLVVWKGRRDLEEEAEAERAEARVGMKPLEVRWVGPYAGSENRHLHVLGKTRPTPEGLPRRPGMAKKRPFGA